jgi:hypothetical protein
MLLSLMVHVMSELDNEIAAYETMRADLENHHMGQWVLVFGGKLEGVYHSFDDAAGEAVTRHGRGPYLIRQVGAAPMTMPASVIYNLQNADH